MSVRAATCTVDIDLSAYSFMLVSSDGEQRQTYTSPADEFGATELMIDIPLSFLPGEASLLVVEPVPECQDTSSCVAPEVKVTIKK